MIQRAVLTVHGRQFTLNGYLALSKTGGKRLIVTENFGGVLADVLVKPDGEVFVMRSSQLFRPEWIQRLCCRRHGMYFWRRVRSELSRKNVKSDAFRD